MLLTLVVVNRKPMLKKSYYLGLLAYPVLLLLAIVFYKERTIFTDIAYHLFYIVRDESTAIQNYRFGAIFTQLFPLLGVKAGASLNSLLYIYSVAFIIYYFVCYLFCGLVFKNYRWGLILLLLNTLFVTHTFYWIQSELPQTLALLCVFFAYTTRENSTSRMPVWGALFAVVAIITIAFSHPLTLFPFMFAVLFFLLRKERAVSAATLVGIAVFYMAVLFVKSRFFKTPYDTGATDTAVNNLKNVIYFFRSYATQLFFKRALTTYLLLFAILIATITVYAKQKRKKEMILLITSFFGYLVLINISYSGDEVTDFYRENMYLPLALIVGLPFIYDVMPLTKKDSLKIAMMALVILLCVVRIYFRHDIYTNRLTWERKFLQEHKGEKLLLKSTQPVMDTLLMTWGTPYEFWLLSTTETDSTASVVITDDVEGKLWAGGQRKMFISQWDFHEYKTLPERYFRFRDTLSGYNVIELPVSEK